jgi:hypothetical protein
LPHKSHDYYFDGYARSGNTFINGFIKYLKPNINGTSHLHCIAPLKIAFKQKIPIVIVIRQPFDVIVSNIFRKNSDINEVSEKLINEISKEYITYYEFVLANRKDLQIIKFSDFFNDEFTSFIGILKYLDIHDFNKDDLKKKLDNFNLKMQEKESNKTNQLSSLPNNKRKEFKIEIKDRILNNKNFREAKDIYNKF